MRNILRLLRRKFYTKKVKRTCKSFIEPLTVNRKTIVTKKTILGKNTHFNGMKILGCGKVKIGDNFHSGINCLIITHNHNYEGTKIPYDETVICKDVNIRENVWLGQNVTILGGVTIGEGAIIQAGSVIVFNIPDFAIAGGHPAKVFKYREKDHYLDLKKQKKFH